MLLYFVEPDLLEPALTSVTDPFHCIQYACLDAFPRTSANTDFSPMLIFSKFIKWLVKYRAIGRGNLTLH